MNFCQSVKFWFYLYKVYWDERGISRPLCVPHSFFRMCYCLTKTMKFFILNVRTQNISYSFFPINELDGRHRGKYHTELAGAS